MYIEQIGRVFRVALVAVSLVAIAMVGLYPAYSNRPAPEPEPLWEEAAASNSVEVEAPAEELDTVEPVELVTMPAVKGDGPVVGSTEAYKVAVAEAEEAELVEESVEAEQSTPVESTKSMSPEGDEHKEAQAESSPASDKPEAAAPSAPTNDSAPPVSKPAAKADPAPKAPAGPAPKAPAKSAHYSNKTTIHARTDVATTVRSVKGIGTIPIVITLDPKSTAPALPTYVLVSCSDRLNPYSGGYNTIGGQTTVKHLPYSGDCVVKVRSAYPTKNWTGQYNAIHVSTGTPTPSKASGEPYTGRAQWTSRPVSSSSDFQMSAPAGFEGHLVMKVTACSTRGGATDKTASFACDGHVNRTHSKGRIEVLNGGKIVATQPFDIELNKHHEAFTIPVKLSSPDMTIRVVKTSGTSILVHGDGSSVVGVY